MTPTTKPTAEPSCAGGLVIRTRVDVLTSSDDKQWTAIEKLKNRLPTWGTLALTSLAGGLGATLGVMLSK